MQAYSPWELFRPLRAPALACRCTVRGVNTQASDSSHALVTRCAFGLVLLFSVFAYSEDVLQYAAERSKAYFPGWTLILFDLVVLSVVAVLVCGGVRPRPPISRWAFAVALTVALDAAAIARLFDSPGMGLLSCFLYLIPQALLLYWVLTILDGRPGAADFLWLGSPLLLGTFLAWVASAIGWPLLDELSAVDELPVSAEFFAQASQILPVLFLALMLEIRFLSRLESRMRSRRALAFVVAGLILLAEVLALSVLVYPDELSLHEREIPAFISWHVYIALLATVAALLVSLLSIVLGVLRSAAARDGVTGPTSP